MKALLRSLIIVFLTAATANFLWAAEIAVLMSSDAAIYQEALQGFREAVPNRSVNVQLLPNRLEERANQLKILRSDIKPKIVFVIGTSALQAVTGKITDVPIVHSMVFNPQPGTVAENKNMTGVGMIPSPTQAMSLIKELNPKIRRVGVMHDPARSNSLYRQAQLAGQKESIRLVDRKIEAPAEIAAALKSFEGNIDLLWLWPDERFLGDEILQRIFLFSFENKIPVLGLSERHTQMGALLSLSYGSAKDMGKQAGELVNRMLSNPQADIVPLVVPRQVKLTVNLKTGRKLDITVPESVVRHADNAIKAPVYKEGDWWVFRLREIWSSGKTEETISRVMYRNGKFESEDPRMLTGGNILGTPSFLPFATLHFRDPERKWLDFPLVPGRSWSFRYRRKDIGGSLTHSWGNANVEVGGLGLDTIQTDVGKLEAIRIDRTDTVSGVGYLTYFYSPRTKSVIKLKAERDSGIFSMPDHRSWELELVAYGYETKTATESGKVSGVSPTTYLDKALSLVKELNPKIRRVGVIYDPARSNSLYWQAQSAAQRENIRLIDRKIRSPGEIAAALKSFENEIDLLWLWPDERFLGDEILQRIFLFSFENKIPVLGLSERHTQMGALLSLSYGSAMDMGRQAGEVVNRIVSGENAAALPLTLPRETRLTVNLKAARKLDIGVPDGIIRRADNAIKAPVYKEGDWWVFRTKTYDRDGRVEIEDHRVTYKEGDFDADSLSFLRGENQPGRYFSSLPFASVYLTDPNKRFLDFPLVTGKKWSFWYLRRYGLGRGSRTFATAEAEVIGHALIPIETPAGRLIAIEIKRVDFLSAPLNLTYFYSPQTKSVVKLNGEVDPAYPGSSARRFELELLSYGTAEAEKRSTR